MEYGGAAAIACRPVLPSRWGVVLVLIVILVALFLILVGGKLPNRILKKCQHTCGSALAKAMHGVLGAGGIVNKGVDLAGNEGECGAEVGRHRCGRWAAAGHGGRNKRRITCHILNRRLAHRAHARI